MPIITNTNPGNFLADGAYVAQVPAAPATPVGAQTGLVAVVGTANYGPVGTPQTFSSVGSMFNVFGNGLAIAGNGAALPNSLVLEALAAMPECQQFVGVRITDGTTDTAATIAIKDTAAATIATLTSKYTGSLPNPGAPGTAASATVSIKSGTLTANPVLRVTIAFPGFATELYDNIVAYATTAYDAPTFKANLLAAINGTLPNTAGSPRWTASSGASTVNPQIGTPVSATGGTDGVTNITSALLLGTDGNTGRLGMYALRGQVQGGQVLLAGNTDPTIVQTAVAFAVSENCFVHYSFPTGTTTDAAAASKTTNNLTGDSLLISEDWTNFYDPYGGVSRLVAPQAKIAGVIASLAAYLYPGNKPYVGVTGITGTERTASPVSFTEGGVRASNGILYLTNNPQLYPRAIGYGLAHGLTSSGKLISDVRMQKALSLQVQQALGPLVGEMQGAAAGDPLRRNAKDRLDQIFQGLLKANPPQIAAYQDVTDTSLNTPLTVSQGFLIISTQVTTLSAARFVLDALQVGSTVTINTTPVAGS